MNDIDAGNAAARYVVKVVVAGRGQADIYDAVGLGKSLTLVRTFKNPAAHRHERDLVSDSPGRTFNRMAGIHQSYGNRHKIRDEATESFARELGKALTTEARSVKCAGIVLIGAPRFLNQLQRVVPRAVQTKVIGRIPKDLGRQDLRTINRYLSAAKKNQEFLEIK